MGWLQQRKAIMLVYFIIILQEPYGYLKSIHYQCVMNQGKAVTAVTLSALFHLELRVK